VYRQAGSLDDESGAASHERVSSRGELEILHNIKKKTRDIVLGLEAYRANACGHKGSKLS
jgi:hypothetical protein